MSARNLRAPCQQCRCVRYINPRMSTTCAAMENSDAPKNATMATLREWTEFLITEIESGLVRQGSM